MKAKKPKKGFLDGYKTYNPHKEGYGNATDWASAFSARMGIKEATETLGSKDPYVLLGLNRDATWDEIRSAHRKMVMKWHPDRHLDDKQEAERMFKIIQAAYEVLADKHGR